MLGSGLWKECKIQNFEMNFRRHFDTCISCNIQLIDLILKILVDLDFNDRLYSFLHWGCCIGIVLSRHLARSICRAKRFLDLVTSQYRLFPRRHKTCTSNLYVDLIRKMGEGIPTWKVVELLEVE